MKFENRETADGFAVGLKRQHRRARPRLRRAITLTEVLISMGILTLGLLGVAALFPVGGFYMQKAEIADRGSAIAQQAMNDLLARGMLNPNTWQMLAPSPPLTSTFQIDGAANTYSRSVGKAMAKEMTLAPYLSRVPLQRPKYLAERFGGAYVIDPMGLAATTLPSTNIVNPTVSPFPCGAYYWPLSPNYTNCPNWRTWQSAGGPEFWPIRRVTFDQPDPNFGRSRLSAPVAEALFSGQDDLALDMPERDDHPAVQRWDIANLGATPTPLARQWAGDYSWLTTVVPTTSAAHAALGRNPESHEYDVSVVVFHKRVVSRTSPQSQAEARDPASDLSEQERVFKSRVVSTGLNGGEMLLIAPTWTLPSRPYEQLKAGEWLMVCGPHPASTDSDPRFVLKWYQVMSIDEELSPPLLTDARSQRLVTLRGPKWPWLPAPGGATDDDELSNNLCVGVFPGAVAVHTKTLRLEGPNSGGQAASFGTGGTVDPPPWKEF